jgi:predicted nucleotidyltransferase
MPADTTGKLISSISSWFKEQTDVQGVLLIGSYARGNPQADSDIDFVVVVTEPEKYLTATDWTRYFGEPIELRIEDWGALSSVRVFYKNKIEIEFGFVSPDWVSVTPIDPGTLKAVQRAAKILYDKSGRMAALLLAASSYRSD